MKQYEAVIETLDRLGGMATLGELNREVMKLDGCTWRTKTPFASIRRIVQTTPGIYKIKPGLYALESHRAMLEANGYVVETEKNIHSKAISDLNHYYYQGLLLRIGEMEGYETFVPEQDKNRCFLRKDLRLKDMRTLQEMPRFSYDNIVRRCSTIDVIWFNHRLMPNSFFEIEHTTDFQNSLLKFSDLQDFYTRMIIVADKRRKEEFMSKMGYSAFDELNRNRRVSFLNYEALVKQYEQLLERQSFETII